jgi:predicted nucleotidyltransferase
VALHLEMTGDIEGFLQRVCDWARGQSHIASVILVGSYARGQASPSSDVDLVLRVEDPDAFIHNRAWASDLGDVVRTELEDWGRVQSVRVWYAEGLEVEYGFTDLEWGTDPDDSATQDVIRDGYRALCARDPDAGRSLGEDEHVA